MVLLREGSVPALAVITAAFRQKNAENSVLDLILVALKMLARAPKAGVGKVHATG